MTATQRRLDGMIAGKDGKKPDAPANQTQKSGLSKAELEEANTEWSESRRNTPKSPSR